MSKSVTINAAYLPNIQAVYKSLPEGGARVQIELTPDEAPLFFAWMVGNRMQDQTFKMTCEVEGA